MILVFIAIAGLLLSNKDNVISFINKHNINWFERNLVNSQQQQQQQQIGKNLNKVSQVPARARADNDDDDAAASVAQNQLAALANERELNAVSPRPMIPKEMGNRQAISALSTAKSAPKTITTTTKTVIAITKPPIIMRDDTITTAAAVAAEYEPAWKSLIDKIKAANSNRGTDNFAGTNNAIGRNVGKSWSTVMSRIRATTTMNTPTTTTTTVKPKQSMPLPPQQQPPVFVQQEIGKCFYCCNAFFNS